MWTLTGGEAINDGARYSFDMVCLPCVSSVALAARNPRPPINTPARYWLPLALNTISQMKTAYMEFARIKRSVASMKKA